MAKTVKMSLICPWIVLDFFLKKLVATLKKSVLLFKHDNATNNITITSI